MNWKYLNDEEVMTINLACTDTSPVELCFQLLELLSQTIPDLDNDGSNHEIIVAEFAAWLNEQMGE